MKKYVIVDTNVLVSANGRDTHADLSCQLACIDILEKIKSTKILLLDCLGLILDEYSRHCNYAGEPGVGDYFFKYALDNQLIESRCRVVTITKDENRAMSFLEFPNHPDLSSFDISDHKFVAVSISSSVDPPIYNATDSDWEEFKDALKDSKIVVIQLCPQHARKNILG